MQKSEQGRRRHDQQAARAARPPPPCLRGPSLLLLAVRGSASFSDPSGPTPPPKPPREPPLIALLTFFGLSFSLSDDVIAASTQFLCGTPVQLRLCTWWLSAAACACLGGL
jgi:hypothetical protein